MTPGALFLCLMLRAIDGDTLECANGMRVRLWGIDAPERGQIGAQAATEALQGRALQILECEARGTSWGRVVALCRDVSGSDIACTQIQKRHAKPARRFSGDHYDRCAKA